MTNSADEYEQFRSRCSQCTECGLCATRHQVVVDRGAPTARLLFIGEAPGAVEDASGQAFAGPAGQLLDELLAEAGIGPDRFLIVNVLKCRPPNNNFPGDDQSRFKVDDTVRRCLPWLDQQIDLVQPKVIVLVGHKAAIWTVLRDRKGPIIPMSDLVGRWIKADGYPGVMIFAMYHTSHLLRVKSTNPEQGEIMRKETLAILKMANDALHGVVPETTPLHIRGDDKRYKQLKFF
jgi:uracil-DNA glycosylase